MFNNTVHYFKNGRLTIIQFKTLDNVEFLNELDKSLKRHGNKDNIDNLPCLTTLDTYFDFDKHEDLRESEHIFVKNPLESFKYYTVNNFSKNHKHFKGLSFIHYNAKSLGENMSKIRESLAFSVFRFNCNFLDLY